MVVISDRSWRDVTEGTSYGFFRGDPNVIGLGTPVDSIYWEEVDVVVWQFEADEVQCGDLVFADFNFSESVVEGRDWLSSRGGQFSWLWLLPPQVFLTWQVCASILQVRILSGPRTCLL